MTWLATVDAAGTHNGYVWADNIEAVYVHGHTASANGWQVRVRTERDSTYIVAVHNNQRAALDAMETTLMHIEADRSGVPPETAPSEPPRDLRDAPLGPKSMLVLRTMTAIDGLVPLTALQDAGSPRGVIMKLVPVYLNQHQLGPFEQGETEVGFTLTAKGREIADAYRP